MQQVTTQFTNIRESVTLRKKSGRIALLALSDFTSTPASSHNVHYVKFVVKK